MRAGVRAGVRAVVRAVVRAGVKRPRALVGLGSGWSLRAGWGRGPCEGSSRDSVQRVHWVCRRGRVALQGGRVAADLEKLPRLFKELPG